MNNETGINHKPNCKCPKCHYVENRKPNAYKFLQAQRAIVEHNNSYHTPTFAEYDDEFVFHQT